MVEVVSKEVHYYSSGQLFYEFDQAEYTEYDIIMVEGYLADRWHTFRKNIDYELFNNGIQWLPSGDRPEPPPSTISTAGNIPFEVTYTYEIPPDAAMVATVYPFIKENGKYMTILRTFGGILMRLYETKNNLLVNHDLDSARGNSLDYLASWYNVERMSTETDEDLRNRLLEFLESYVSAGTTAAIKAAIESYTGEEPSITELWQNLSYFNYNIDDYNDSSIPPDQWRTYLFSGGNPDNVYTFQAYFYDPLFQLNTFFCILTYDTIYTYGLNNIKRLINSVKAAGVQGYVGWLVNENFDNLNDWEVVT